MEKTETKTAFSTNSVTTTVSGGGNKEGDVSSGFETGSSKTPDQVNAVYNKGVINRKAFVDGKDYN